ncbi:halocyanin domain-containing protein [Halobaculum sp. D14]|uniref:halocyanin domain-containing protein n=1 Tax=unclassified Halobaculum TaxID=2640896 RepID=UPI003EB91F48
MAPDEQAVGRRTVLKATGASLLGAALAGCTSGGSAGSSAAGQSGGSSTSTPTQSPEPTDSSSGGGTKGFGGWFDNVGNYDGVVDETGSDSVTVTVGAEGNGGAYAFAPAAVAVSPGTTVVWKWTGKGSMHNVVDVDGGFESDLLNEQGATFEHTFDATGTYKYYCEPHKAMGMKGAVVVK